MVPAWDHRSRFKFSAWENLVSLTGVSLWLKGDKVAFGEPSDSEDEDDTKAKPGRGAALRPSQMQANGPSKGKGAGGRGGGKGGAKDASERQAEMRQRQLEEESQVDEHLWSLIILSSTSDRPSGPC